jgi:ribosome biogenesis protein Tsr3
VRRVIGYAFSIMLASCKDSDRRTASISKMELCGGVEVVCSVNQCCGLAVCPVAAKALSRAEEKTSEELVGCKAWPEGFANIAKMES